jgi:hypothetical protein
VEEEQGRWGGWRRGGRGNRRERETEEVKRIWAEAVKDTPDPLLPAIYAITRSTGRRRLIMEPGLRAARRPRLGRGCTAAGTWHATWHV